MQMRGRSRYLGNEESYQRSAGEFFISLWHFLDFSVILFQILCQFLDLWVVFGDFSPFNALLRGSHGLNTWRMKQARRAANWNKNSIYVHIWRACVCWAANSESDPDQWTLVKLGMGEPLHPPAQLKLQRMNRKNYPVLSAIKNQCIHVQCWCTCLQYVQVQLHGRVTWVLQKLPCWQHLVHGNWQQYMAAAVHCSS